MRPHPWLVVVLVGATIGLVFAGVSTFDFVQHLDRQVHSLHCSFIPGMGHESGTSGCQVAMMSTYSSVFRTKVWGGVPIALPAMSVFAFILLAAIDLVLTRRKDDRRATAFLALATALPALMSIVMLAISLTKLGTTCKLCVCIYISSALCLAGAIMTWRRAGRPLASSATGKGQLVPVETGGVTMGRLGGAFGIGVAFVAVPVILYLALAPDNSKFIGTCDTLPKQDDPYGVMVRITNDRVAADAAPAIEVLDPLCPACKAFEERLEKSGQVEQLDRKAILFPLDNACNWMVTEATHPGACTVSEAVLCAGAKAPDVIAWAFEVQDRIREETAKDPAAAARIVKERFPELASCVGSPEARSKLNKSLRWSVANNVRVLTPQLFVRGAKLCDEDVDLGLEYALPRLIESEGGQVIAARVGVLAVLLAIPAGLTTMWIHSAETRLEETAPGEAAPTASAADVGYCSPDLKRILRRVLMSCGLVGGGAARGCQPVQAKNVATMSGKDFNALFKPMKDRGGIVQFPNDKSDLDPSDISLVDSVFADQKGASWFFVVARASPTGTVEHNRELSKARAEAVMNHLKTQFKDPDLEKEVGMLWLGDEFAQLETEFCNWKRSSGGSCGSEEVNRSAFVAWIDCQL